jgi:hypothetical protein
MQFDRMASRRAKKVAGDRPIATFILDERHNVKKMLVVISR